MAQPSAVQPPITAPQITQADLLSFHSAHFSTPCTEHFGIHFLGPVDETQYEEYEEEDDLGYYDDGVKRTLTDEQIAMFRHSEIQTLLRARRHEEENREFESGEDLIFTHTSLDREESRKGTPSSHGESSTAKSKPKEQNSRGKRGKRGNNRQNRNVKPDLRKRTWDKVERGMESLDYGEEVQAKDVKEPQAGPQRRKISYDDM